eukprot:549636-Amphidinium_carterae.1
MNRLVGAPAAAGYLAGPSSKRPGDCTGPREYQHLGSARQCPNAQGARPFVAGRPQRCQEGHRPVRSRAPCYKESRLTLPLGEVPSTSLRGRLTWPPCTKSIRNSSGEKFQSPRIIIGRMNILRLPAATTPKTSVHYSQFFSWERGSSEL